MPTWKNGAFPVLSELGTKTIAVECEQCNRRGRYRADRLLADFGDVSQVEVLELIAKRGGCMKAAFPPNPADLLYADKRCRIHLVVPGNKSRPPALGTAVANGWRLFVICERHHQGLKAVKPCRGATELDLRTLIAAFGPTISVLELGKLIKAPCCGSDTFRINWQLPDGTENSPTSPEPHH